MTSAVSKSFQIPVHYYILVKMDGFITLVDSVGGLDLLLHQPVAHYPVGVTHLGGRAALAFARDRAETDDFARMYQAHLLIKAMLAQVFKVKVWGKLPRALKVLKAVAESNIPFWQWPYFVFMILRSYMDGTEGYTITRDMVHPKITPQGEQAIEPKWDKILALTHAIFDE